MEVRVKKSKVKSKGEKRGESWIMPYHPLPYIKGTASIKMHEIDSSHVKETACSFRMFERSWTVQIVYVR